MEISVRPYNEGDKNDVVELYEKAVSELKIKDRELSDMADKLNKEMEHRAEALERANREKTVAVAAAEAAAAGVRDELAMARGQIANHRATGVEKTDEAAELR